MKIISDSKSFGKSWLESFKDHTNIQSIALWTVAVITGLVSVGYAKIFKASEKLFLSQQAQHPRVILALTPLLFFAAAFLVKRYSPESAGSGIPQILASLEEKYEGEGKTFIDRLLSVRVILMKILSSILCILGGGAIGREGPTLQISAGLFHLMGKMVRKVNQQTNDKLWIIAGSSAGLAAAFNTPLGGIVYAIEEVGRDRFHGIRHSLLGAVIISGLVAQWILGNYLYLGYPVILPFGFSFFWIAIAVGFLAGSLGAIFGKIIVYLSQIKMIKHWSAPLFLGLLVAGIVYFEPGGAGGGTEVMNDLLFGRHAPSPWLTGARILTTLFSYLTGVAGGIFSPALAIGASMGAQFSQLAHIENANLVMLLGMIGFLTGMTQTPFTSFILVLEMSDHHSAIFPMMTTALIANMSARGISKTSVYEQLSQRYKAKKIFSAHGEGELV